MSFAGHADFDERWRRAAKKWRPPPRLRLSEWADQHFILSAESAAVAGPWRTLPYQREILDAISDPTVEQVSVMKSARVGYTLCMSAAIGYFVAQDPTSILIVQPTVDDATNFSKETIAPMLRDVPALAGIMFKDIEDRERGRRRRRGRGRGHGPKDPSDTIRHKIFPGGVLNLIGANSGAGFRRISRRVVMFDEVDAYPPSAGAEGDPINLGIKRTEAFHNRKIVAGSTPLIAGTSRIEEMFDAGDRRRYHVPCPSCGHMDILVFQEGERGHFMQWPEGKPEEAYFVCKANGCVIEHHQKRWMVERGEWRPDRPGGAHRSYHLWSALSYSPNASWGKIASEFVTAKRGGPEKLKTFINTTLGETWQERGEAPDWERLYTRRETYPIGSVPAGVKFLTAGVDVQKDRFVYEVVGWSATKESWSVDAGVLMGDTSNEASWGQLDELLARTFDGAGRSLPIALLGIDSGYNTQQVYTWARRHQRNRVIACKGVARARSLVGVPTPVDVTIRGKRFARGYKVWMVGAGIAKGELYGWLRLPRPPAGELAPPGYCHFPEYSEDYFKQLTAEHLVTVRKKNGYTVLEWQLLPNRENHFLDCRVLARAAASVLRLDRLAPPAPPPPAAAPQASHPPAPATAAPAPSPPATAEPPPAPPAPPPAAAPAPRPPRRAGGGFLGGRLGPWISKRR